MRSKASLGRDLESEKSSPSRLSASTMSGSHEPVTNQTRADVKLAELKVLEVLVFLVLREARASVGHEIVVLVPSQNLTTKCELQGIPKTNRLASRAVNVTQNFLSGVQIVDDELCGNSFFLTFAKSSLTKSELLKKSRRKSKRGTENWPVEKKSLGGWRSSRR